MSKLIITAAITGSVHIPTMSDYLPLTPEQIVEDAVKAYEAGQPWRTSMCATPKTASPRPTQTYSVRY